MVLSVNVFVSSGLVCSAGAGAGAGLLRCLSGAGAAGLVLVLVLALALVLLLPLVFCLSCLVRSGLALSCPVWRCRWHWC